MGLLTIRDLAGFGSLEEEETIFLKPSARPVKDDDWFNRLERDGWAPGISRTTPKPEDPLAPPTRSLDYSEYKRLKREDPEGLRRELESGRLQPPPDLWREQSGGPAEGQEQRSQFDEHGSSGVKKDFTDVLPPAESQADARRLADEAREEARWEADPLERNRLLENARAYDQEAQRLAAGGARRPGVPVKRRVQWQGDLTPGHHAENQQREMEERGVRTYRGQGWDPGDREAIERRIRELRQERDRLRQQREEERRRRQEERRQKREEERRRREEERRRREEEARARRRAEEIKRELEHPDEEIERRIREAAAVPKGTTFTTPWTPPLTRMPPMPRPAPPRPITVRDTSPSIVRQPPAPIPMGLPDPRKLIVVQSPPPAPRGVVSTPRTSPARPAQQATPATPTSPAGRWVGPEEARLRQQYGRALHGMDLHLPPWWVFALIGAGLGLGLSRSRRS